MPDIRAIIFSLCTVAQGIAAAVYIGEKYLGWRKERKSGDMKPFSLRPMLVLTLLGGTLLTALLSLWFAFHPHNTSAARTAVTTVNQASSAPSPSQPTPIPQSTTAKIKSPAKEIKPEGTKRDSPLPSTGPLIGKESTVLGNLPTGAVVGDKSVYMGSTDSKGNAIYTQPGAYGYDAHAGPGSIAVGSHAGSAGNAPQPAYQQDCKDSACAQGSGSQATFNQYGAPPIKVTASLDTPQPPPSSAGHPRASIKFYTDRNDDDGQFAVICDRACKAVSLCVLPGSNQGKFGSIIGRPDVAAFVFQRQFPAAYWCVLTVESEDDQPVKILGVKTLTFTNLTPPQ